MYLGYFDRFWDGVDSKSLFSPWIVVPLQLACSHLFNILHSFHHKALSVNTGLLCVGPPLGSLPWPSSSRQCPPNRSCSKTVEWNSWPSKVQAFSSKTSTSNLAGDFKPRRKIFGQWGWGDKRAPKHQAGHQSVHRRSLSIVYIPIISEFLPWENFSHEK